MTLLHELRVSLTELNAAHQAIDDALSEGASGSVLRGLLDDAKGIAAEIGEMLAETETTV